MMMFDDAGVAGGPPGTNDDNVVFTFYQAPRGGHYVSVPVLVSYAGVLCWCSVLVSYAGVLC